MGYPVYKNHFLVNRIEQNPYIPTTVFEIRNSKINNK